MATGDVVSEFGAKFASKIFGSVLWVGVALIIIGIFTFIIWWFAVYQKRFDIKVKVISERANDKNKIIWDKAAILKDRKTGTKFFKLWTLKVELPIPKFNVLQQTNTGDYLEIYRKTEDEFYFLRPPVIDKFSIVKSDGRLYPMSEQEHKQIDADIAYWNVKRKERNKSIFSQDSLLMKLLPYFPIVIGGMIMIFMLYVLMDSLPTILQNLKDLTIELKSLKGAEAVVTKLAMPLTHGL